MANIQPTIIVTDEYGDEHEAAPYGLQLFGDGTVYMTVAYDEKIVQIPPQQGWAFSSDDGWTYDM